MNFFEWLETHGKVRQELKFKKIRGMDIRNPQKLTLTVAGNHHNDKKYSTWEGTNYRLAEILINGEGQQVPRPFMFKAKERIKNNAAARKKCAEFLKMSMLKPSKSLAAEGGIWINWDNYGEWVCSLIHEWLMDGTLNLEPLQPGSKKKRSWAGYGTEPPLYATGELAKMITYVVGD